jgi:enoyl-CoA hydratase/carnithine racemase
MTAGDSGLGVERHDDVLVLVVDRPKAANALNAPVNDALVAALADAGSEATVRAVVLAAAGERVYSAGADLKEYAELDPAAAARRRRAVLVRTLDAVSAFKKPLVAAVQGKALGAGCMLAMLADEVLATESAQFGLPEIVHDMPSPIGGVIVAARGGPVVARRMLQTGESVDARQALRLALVDEIVDAGELRARAIARGRALGAMPRFAFAANKRFLNAPLRTALESAAREAGRLQDLLENH